MHPIVNLTLLEENSAEFIEQLSLSFHHIGWKTHPSILFFLFLAFHLIDWRLSEWKMCSVGIKINDHCKTFLLRSFLCSLSIFCVWATLWRRETKIISLNPELIEHLALEKGIFWCENYNALQLLVK
jgi:hypothetical protein